MDSKTPRKTRPDWLLWGCAIVAVTAAIIAAVQAPVLGWPAFLLLVGLAAISLIVIFGLVISKPISEVDEGLDVATLNALKDAFDNSQTPTLITKDGKPFYSNAAYLALAGNLGAIGVSGTAPTIDRLFSAKAKSASAAIFRLHHSRKAGENAEDMIQTTDANGKLKDFRVKVSGLPEGQLWTVEDICHVKQPAGGASLDKAPVGLFSVLPDGSVMAMNDVLRRWIGAAEGDTPNAMSDFIENPDSLLGSPQTPGRIVRNDTRLITRKGVVIPAVMTGAWQEFDTGQLYASVALYGHSGSSGVQASSATATAAAALAAGSKVSGDTDSLAPFGIARLDNPDLTKAAIVEANAALVGMSGGQIQNGDRFAALFKSSDEAPEFLSGVNAPMGTPYDAILAGRDARPVNVYIVPEDEGVIAYFVDVSKRRELEGQLAQSQKMQAIGQLAGGVAHDFNNLLQAIRLNTDELLGRHPVGDPSYPELQKINQTVSRAAGLVKKLLAFSRKQTLRAEVLDVTDALSDVSVLLKQVLVEKVTLNMVHGRSLPNIRVDRGQLETVLMNLCVNARDALMDEGRGGDITITTSVVTPEVVRADGLTKKAAESYVCIAVMDNGTGMDEDTQAKIFEPFFTTKEQGKGTGLGLATVYGIIEQSGGHLAVESELGVGTTFKIYMPATDETADAATPAALAKAAPAKPSDLAGQGTILFVEDEENVRIIAAKTLRKRGYIVIEAEDGEMAYEILQEGEHTFDLMVSDVVMPGMDGPALLKAGRELLGEAKIVFISGYAQEEFSDILAEHPDITFLPKPFTLLQLAQRVKLELSQQDED